MLNKKEILSEFKNNALKILLTFENKENKEKSINKVLAKIEGDEILNSLSTSDKQVKNKMFNLLSNNIDGIINVLENDGYIYINSKLNPLLNSNLKVSFIKEDLNANNYDLIVDKNNFKIYEKHIESLLVAKSLINPLIDINKQELTNAEIYQIFIDNAQYILSYNVASNKSYLNDLFNNTMPRDNYQDLIKNLTSIMLEMPTLKSNIYAALMESENVFPLAIKKLSKLNTLSMLQDYEKYTYRILFNNTEDLVCDVSLNDVKSLLIWKGISNVEIGELYLKMNIADNHIYEIYNAQYQEISGISYRKNIADFSPDWKERFDKKMFEIYESYDSFLDNRHHKMYGSLINKAKKAMVEQYNDKYPLEKSFTYMKNENTTTAMISLNNLSKRVCSSVYASKLILDYDYVLGDNKIKVRTSHHNLTVTIPSDLKEETGLMIGMAIIDYLLSLKEKENVLSMSNVKINTMVEGFLNQFLHVFELNKQLEGIDSNKKLKYKRKI